MSEPGKSSRRAAYGEIGLVALALGFLVAVAVVNVVFRGVRIDLTENRLYTLSEGTIRIVESIPEPINVYLYFSERATADIPFLRTYATRVREMLEEFASRSGGQLRLTVVDPLPFSEEEDRAGQFGLQGINLGNNPDPVYLGVAGTNSVGDEEVIPFLDPNKETFLEYELAKLVQTLANPQKPVVGLLSELPLLAGFDPMTQQMREPWVVAEQLRQLFELRVLDPSLESVDPEVTVLMVVHPKELPDAALYAIDQFVLGGGRALLFVDPYAEIDQPPPMDPMMSMMANRSSDLERLLNAWGVSVPPDAVVLDDRFGLNVMGMQNRPVRHLGIIGVDGSGLDPDDVITSGLTMLHLGYTGHIATLDNAAAVVTPLVRSSDLAGLLPVEQLAMLPDPALLRDGFTATGERYVLAARLSGKVPSAFPQGLPAPPGSETAGPPTGHLAESTGPINVVLVADADLLADRLWVQSQNFFGQRLNTAFANNGDLVVNALDNLLGSGDLISIRGRAAFSRPFQRVQELRRVAEARFRETQQRLQDELRDTESRLVELQASRTDQGAMILSPAQQAEIERFQQRRLAIRQELRQVQRGLDQDIERLGTTLKIINIGLVPALIGLGVLGWYLRRRLRPRRPA